MSDSNTPSSGDETWPNLLRKLTLGYVLQPVMNERPVVKYLSIGVLVLLYPFYVVVMIGYLAVFGVLWILFAPMRAGQRRREAAEAAQAVVRPLIGGSG